MFFASLESITIVYFLRPISSLGQLLFVGASPDDAIF